MGWAPFGEGYELDAAGGRLSEASTDGWGLRMASADGRGERGAVQTVVVEQAAASALVVSGWSRAELVSGEPDGGYALYVDITYADGSNTWGFAVPFDTGSHGWQLKSGVIEARAPVRSLNVYVMFRGHAGAAAFDDVRVMSLTEGLCEYTRVAAEGAAAAWGASGGAEGG